MLMTEAEMCILKTDYFWHNPKNAYHTLNLTIQVAYIKGKHTPLNIKASIWQVGILSSECYSNLLPDMFWMPCMKSPKILMTQEVKSKAESTVHYKLQNLKFL
jgi:hypothetical protein